MEKLEPSESKQKRQPTLRLSSWHQEKEVQLQGLNDRLAVYMKKVAFLEEQNAAFRETLKSYQNETVSAKSQLRKIYDDERLVLRSSLDDLHRETAKLKLDNDRICEQYEKVKNNEREKDVLLDETDEKVTDAEFRLNELQRKFNECEVQLATASEKWKMSENKMTELTVELNSLKDALDREIVTNVDLANQNLSIKEEYEFSQIVSDAESSAVSKSVVDVETLREIIDQLSRLRNESKEKLELLRLDSDQKTAMRLGKERERADRAADSLRIIQENYKLAKYRLEETKREKESQDRRLGKLLSTVSMLEHQIGQLETANNYHSLIQEKEIERLNIAIAEFQAKYDDLLQVNITLDREICTYKQLMESGEERLKIARKRTFSDEDEEQSYVSLVSSVKTEGAIGISSASEEMVKIAGKSDKPVSISGWQLKWFDTTATDEELLVAFKFPRNSTIDGELCVYSSNAGPRGAFRLKQRSWPCNDNPHVLVLENAKGSVVSKLTVCHASEECFEPEVKKERDYGTNEQNVSGTIKESI
ncbi:hypothetical protein ACOME3_007657 [Neoechinorhynchus agilis]